MNGLFANAIDNYRPAFMQMCHLLIDAVRARIIANFKRFSNEFEAIFDGKTASEYKFRTFAARNFESWF